MDDPLRDAHSHDAQDPPLDPRTHADSPTHSHGAVDPPLDPRTQDAHAGLPMRSRSLKELDQIEVLQRKIAARNERLAAQHERIRSLEDQLAAKSAALDQSSRVASMNSAELFHARHQLSCLKIDLAGQTHGQRSAPTDPGHSATTTSSAPSGHPQPIANDDRNCAPATTTTTTLAQIAGAGCPSLLASGSGGGSPLRTGPSANPPREGAHEHASMATTAGTEETGAHAAAGATWSLQHDLTNCESENALLRAALQDRDGEVARLRELVQDQNAKLQETALALAGAEDELRTARADQARGLQLLADKDAQLAQLQQDKNAQLVQLQQDKDAQLLQLQHDRDTQLLRLQQELVDAQTWREGLVAAEARSEVLAAAEADLAARSHDLQTARAQLRRLRVLCETRYAELYEVYAVLRQGRDAFREAVVDTTHRHNPTHTASSSNARNRRRTKFPNKKHSANMNIDMTSPDDDCGATNATGGRARQLAEDGASQNSGNDDGNDSGGGGDIDDSNGGDGGSDGEGGGGDGDGVGGANTPSSAGGVHPYAVASPHGAGVGAGGADAADADTDAPVPDLDLDLDLDFDFAAYTGADAGDDDDNDDGFRGRGDGGLHAANNGALPSTDDGAASASATILDAATAAGSGVPPLAAAVGRIDDGAEEYNENASESAASGRGGEEEGEGWLDSKGRQAAARLRRVLRSPAQLHAFVSHTIDLCVHQLRTAARLKEQTAALREERRCALRNLQQVQAEESRSQRDLKCIRSEIERVILETRSFEHEVHKLPCEPAPHHTPAPAPASEPPIATDMSEHGAILMDVLALRQERDELNWERQLLEQLRAVRDQAHSADTEFVLTAKADFDLRRRDAETKDATIRTLTDELRQCAAALLQYKDIVEQLQCALEQCQHTLERGVAT